MKAKILAVIVILAMAVSLIPAFGIAHADNPVEVLSMRTETSKTYSYGNDRFAYVGSISAMHYKDNYNNPTEQWKDIDLNWQGNQITKAPFTVSVNGYMLSLYDKKTGSSLSILLSQIAGKSATTVAPIYSKGKVTYPNIALDTDLVINVGNDIVKFSRVLKSSKADTTATFAISKTGEGFVIDYRADFDGKMTDNDVKVTANYANGIITESVDLSKYPKVKYPLTIDPTFSVRTAASADDCRVLRDTAGAAWLYQQTSTYFDAGYFSSSYERLGGGMRFLAVTVPNSATINTSYITFTAIASNSVNTVNTRFTGEDVDDAATFSSLADYQARRGTIVGGANNNYITTAQVDWDAIGAWTATTTYNSPSLNTIIAEITTRGSWASGNDMVIFWDDHDDRSTNSGDNNATRAAKSYDSSSAASPLIYIDYTAASPTVVTNAASSVEATTATLNGDCTSLGGGAASLDERGFDWDVDSGAPYANSWTENAGGYGTGAFTHGITTLPTGTTIYYRAKAKNNLGEWGYGSEVTFLTKPAAPTNVAATDGTWTTKVVITWTKSTGATGYYVYRDGGDVSGLLGDVATYDDTTADAPTVTAGTASATDGSSTSEVTLSIAGAGANNGTTHTYKVIATNATGNSSDSSTNTGYRGTTTLTYQWKVSAADSDAAYGDIGGATTAPYSYMSAPAPTVVGGTGDASDGTSAVHVTLSVSGESATVGAGRWFYCVVSMTGAASQDTTHNRGYRGVGALTYEWFRSAADSDAAYATISGEGGTTDPYNDTNGVVEPDGRWYKCSVGASGAASQDSTHNRGYKAAADPPDVTTGICSGFTRYEAIVNGVMVDDDAFACTQYGFDYGLTGAYGSSATATKTLADGTPFWLNLTGLQPGTIYHYRAKAYNADGWGYGSDATFNTVGSPVQHEYLNTGQDADSNAIYGNNWTYMQFTVGSVSHTATKVLLYIKRDGTPGTVTISLRHASGGTPTGTDLVSTTFDGDAISTSYTMYSFDITETTLEAASQYAIVVRAIGGSAVNKLYWGTDSGGGLASAVSGHSADGGLSFSSDSPVDALFEIWGNPCIDVAGAKVFTGYMAANDWLIVADVQNIYEPYYPESDPQTIFQLQLIETATIKASVNFKAWDKQPIAIYLNSTAAAPLTWGGGTLKIRIQSLASAAVYTEYALLSTDWQPGNLIYLDGYMQQLATKYQDYYNMTFLVSLPDKGIVLNSDGGMLFVRGIPYIATIRPNMFQTTYGSITSYAAPGTKGYTPSHTTEGTIITSDRIGADNYARLTEAGDVMGGISGKDILGFLLAMAFLLAAAMLGTGHWVGGAVAALPVIGIAIGLGGIGVELILAVASLLIVIIGRWIFLQNQG